MNLSLAIVYFVIFIAVAPLLVFGWVQWKKKIATAATVSAPTESPSAPSKAPTTSTHKPLDYSKWDRVDWDKPEPVPPSDLRKRPTTATNEKQDPARAALLAILQPLLPQVLSPFAVKKLDTEGRGFIMLKCSHKVEDYKTPPPVPELGRQFSVRYIAEQAAGSFLQRMGAAVVQNSLTKLLQLYDPRKELVVAVAAPTESGKGSHVTSLRLGLQPSFEQCYKYPPFTMDVMQINYDEVKQDERSLGSGAKSI